MANLEFCCNPFKQRNHNPEPWRVLPVTKSLREQFRLYLGDDMSICISCKRKLYCTLPTVHDEEPLDDPISEEIDENIHWVDEVNMEAYELNGLSGYHSVEHYLAYQLAKEQQGELRTMQQQESIDTENTSRRKVELDTRENLSSPIKLCNRKKIRNYDV